MKIIISVLISILFLETAYTQENPFFKPYNTKYNLPPFDRIKNEHFLPAFKEGMKQQAEVVKNIAESNEEATFENTIEALEFSDHLLSEVSGVFYNLLSANTNKELQDIAKTLSPLLSSHNDDILMNEKLFIKIKKVYDEKEKTPLTQEQKMLVDEYYKRFIRGGAGLEREKQARFREINERLSLLSLKFGENLLAETNGFKLIIDNKSDLEGLPEGAILNAEETAKKSGEDGKWVFSLSNASIMPFLQYSAKRDLREKILKAYSSRGNNGNDNDNKEIIKEIVNLRIERANLLGFKTHADYVLAESMAKTPKNVYKLLDKLWTPALKKAKDELSDLQEAVKKEGGNFRIEPWDWRYYTEKIRKEKYDIDEEEVRNYFELNNVQKGIFALAETLFGITFTEIKDISLYHEEVKAYEVKDNAGAFIGVFLTDLHPRASKRGGAWMNNFRDQYIYNGKFSYPVIVIVGNFSRPAGDMPSLLTTDETETFFHEFGHALHGLLSKCHYKTLSGTNVSRDFVELPSQIMENWAFEPEVLAMYAKHYKTGEIIPESLIKKLEKTSKFNQGFATTEYIAASYLDMAYHTLTTDLKESIVEFEEEAMNKTGLIPEILPRYRSTYFNHIFNSGYSAGYYSYVWAQVLDADAFQAFKENGIFDKATADSFRRNILESGGSEDPMVLYKRFRGREPDITPLIKRRGLE